MISGFNFKNERNEKIVPPPPTHTQTITSHHSDSLWLGESLMSS